MNIVSAWNISYMGALSAGTYTFDIRARKLVPSVSGYNVEDTYVDGAPLAGTLTPPGTPDINCGGKLADCGVSAVKAGRSLYLCGGEGTDFIRS